MSHFHKLIIAESKKLRGYAMRLTNSADRADDLVQDTLLKAIRNEHLFAVGTNLSAWLCTVMRNEFIASLRKSGRTVLDPDDILAKTLAANDDQYSAFAAKQVISYIVEIPTQYRQPLLLSAQGVPIDEIAVIVGIAVGTVKSRIHRGRHMLANLAQDPDLIRNSPKEMSQ